MKRITEAVYSGDVDHHSGHRDQIPVMLTT
jgi:hypothetical protein